MSESNAPFTDFLGPNGELVIGDDANLPRSGHDEKTVLNLFRRLRNASEQDLRGGNPASLRDHLVMVHAPLVEHCARNFMASGEPLDDLVQEGYVGLIKAVDRFDPNKGIKFSTYACHLISGEIRHYLRDLGRLIHEPGWHFELRNRILRANESLTQNTGRPPTPEEIAQHLNVKTETVREVMQRSQTLNVESLDARDSQEESEGRIALLDRYEAVQGGVRRGDEGRVEDQMFLETALPQLRDMERKAVTLFFYEELSKSEVARRLDISVNYASYLIKRGTDGLRRILESSESPVLPHSLESELSQQQARAAYLLELARGEANTGSKRSFRPQNKVGSIAKPSVVNLSQFSAWMDDEVMRAARFGGQFSVTWLQLRNWDAVTADLAPNEKRAAGVAASALVRRKCRNIDRVAAFVTPDPVGLHFLVLMPSTGIPGASLGKRLSEAFVENRLPGISAALHTRSSFATFPKDGKSSDELFAFLGRKLGEAAQS